MKNPILVVGSINMDLVVEVKKLPSKGETVTGETIRYIPGGKGANQAVAASRLGAEVSLIGKVGNDHSGEELVGFLTSEKLNLKGISKSPLPSGLAVISVDNKGDNTIVYSPGANSEVSAKDIEKQTELIKRSNLILSTFETPVEAVERLFFIAKRVNKTTILNPAPARGTSNNLLKNVDYLVLNETELAFLTKSAKVLESLEDIEKAAKLLKTKGPDIVAVTLGSRGALTVTDTRVIRTEGIKVNAVDTTAAGDCFVGALATQINKGIGLEESLDFANRAAAISVQKWGASSSLPTINEIS
ncbi:MAG TPA: ribokinase [Candidatus Nanoarchaeia archaeon]